MAVNPFAKFQTRQRALPSSSVSSFVIQDGKIIPNKLVNVERALHNSDIFSVVNRIASDVSACEFKVQAPFDEPLNNPNNKISSFNFWQSVIVQMLMTGNAYVPITRKNGLISQFELVTPANVTVTLSDYSKDIQYSVQYDDERGQIDYKSADMLHFRLLTVGDQNNQYIGMSPLESLINDIDIQEQSKRLTLATLKNAINPNYILTVPEGILDNESKDNIRKSFEEQNTGSNSGRAVVLDQGLTMSTVAINSDVAKFLNNYNFSQTQIAKAFGIPDSYLNGDGDEQSSLDQIRAFYANGLQQYIKPVESELTMKLGVKVNLDEMSAIDVDNQQLIDNLAKLATGSTPILSPEMALDILNRKGVFD
ncbi:phage portal protein [Paucilactobacillus sp. N302-9]